MKIAIPTEDGLLSAHFGHCREFTIAEVDPDKQKIIATETLTPPPHEPGVLPTWLNNMGCNLVIAGGIGARAIDMFQNKGVEVIIGAPVLPPAEIVEAYLNGTLQSGMNACDH